LSVKKYQQSTIRGRSNIDNVWDGSILRHYFLWEGHSSKSCSLLWNALGPVETNCSNQTVRTIVENCCIIILLHTLPLEAPAKWNCRCWSALRMVLIWYFWLSSFVPLKDPLSGCHYANDQEVDKAVDAWLATQPETYFSGGIYNRRSWISGLIMLKRMETYRKIVPFCTFIAFVLFYTKSIADTSWLILVDFGVMKPLLHLPFANILFVFSRIHNRLQRPFHFECEIRGSHCGVYEYYWLLGVTSCSQEGRYRRFGGTCFPIYNKDLLDKVTSHSRMQACTNSCFAFNYMFVFIFWSNVRNIYFW
jgi:hypothetical protein